MGTTKEILWDKHWNVDGVTHGDVCDNHTKISLEYAIEVLRDVYDDMDYDKRISNKIEELTKHLNP